MMTSRAEACFTPVTAGLRRLMIPAALGAGDRKTFSATFSAGERLRSWYTIGALALASERPMAQVVATDASLDALAVARANATELRLGNIEFRQGSWFEPLQGDRFDLIASNPPYIAVGDAHLAEGDLPHEPPKALSSGADGLDAVRVIISAARAHLHAGGWLLLEHGWDQGSTVRDLLAAAGFTEVFTERDLELRDRVSAGRKPE